jgi:hypothetical protein
MQAIYRILGWSCASEFANRPEQLLAAEAANELLRTKILEGRPYMASRLGTSEAAVILNYLEIQRCMFGGNFQRRRARWQGCRAHYEEKTAALLCNNAGFFPGSAAALSRFAALTLDNLRLADWMAVWGFVPGESYLLDRYCPQAARCEPVALEPYFFSNPWSEALAGKRVLVIHPFAETIVRQCEKREKLFSNRCVLPRFELQVIPAVQSLADTRTDFEDWFAALAWMLSEMDQRDFDVALIGAGAYGLPLAAHAKLRGKVAIHMGGALQILFGIRGKRWESMEAVSSLFNESWVRPLPEEQVPGSQSVENACYW